MCTIKFAGYEHTIKGGDAMSIYDYKVKAQDGTEVPLETYRGKVLLIVNITKFLIDRDGNLIERFEPTQGMKIVREKIQEVIER